MWWWSAVVVVAPVATQDTLEAPVGSMGGGVGVGVCSVQMSNRIANEFTRCDWCGKTVRGNSIRKNQVGVKVLQGAVRRKKSKWRSMSTTSTRSWSGGTPRSYWGQRVFRSEAAGICNYVVMSRVATGTRLRLGRRRLA